MNRNGCSLKLCKIYVMSMYIYAGAIENYNHFMLLDLQDLISYELELKRVKFVVVSDNFRQLSLSFHRLLGSFVRLVVS